MIATKKAIAAVLFLWTGSQYSLADNVITYDPESLHEDTRAYHDPDEEGGYQIPSQVANARVALDSGDIMDMPSISFPRMRMRSRFAGDEGREQDDSPVVFSRMAATKTLTEEEEDLSIWHGALNGDEVGFATLVRGTNGTLAGSFTVGGTSYMLKTMPDESTVIKAVLFDDIPDEGDDGVPLPEGEDSAEDPLHDFDGEEDFVGSPFQPVDAEGDGDENEEEMYYYGDEPAYRGLRGGTSSLETYDPENKLDIRDSLKGIDHGRMLPRTKIIDLLIVVTNRAMCEEAGQSVGCAPIQSNRRPIESVLRVATAQMNAAMAAIGIRAQVRIVRIHHELSGFDGGVSETTLYRLRGSDDGVLENVRSIRENVGADLVTLITGSAGSVGCGISFQPGSFSVTNYQCIPGFTFIHELGHSFGCQHNSEASSPGTHSYAKGYLNPSGIFRTVMAYDCPGGCPRIPYFSNNDYYYNGRVMGSNSRDNARYLGESARSVELHRPTRIGSPSTYSYYFYIINPYTNKALDVAWAGCSDGQNIHLWHRNGSRAQIFRWGANGSIMNVHCDKAITVSGGHCSTNTNIVLSRYTGSAFQSFRRDSDGTIVSNRCGKTIDIDATNGGADGANIKIYPKNGNWDQQWRIVYF